MLHTPNLPYIDNGNYEVQRTFTINYCSYKEGFFLNQHLLAETRLLRYINNAYGQENDHLISVGGRGGRVTF